MRKHRLFALSLLFFLLLSISAAQATIFGTVRGIVHDPQHRPVAGAQIILKSETSDWSNTAKTDQDGQFEFTAVPLGDYNVTVEMSGFVSSSSTVTVVADSSPVLHFQLKIAPLHQTATVTAQAQEEVANIDSATPTVLVDRQDIEETPGADRTNALQMITDYTPAAYVTHDMLHMRGGHQVEWLIDGVPIPNTNIATNLGPQIDPKDIDYLEIQRGSYDATYGDRTYGIFDIVPRTGFERDKECDFVTSFGNWYQTNDQISCGGHTQKFAYFASLNGNRSDYGLQTPIGRVVHDAENGYGGFGSFIFNPNSKNQYRVVTSLRTDYYQIPIDPNPNSVGNQILSMTGLVPSDGLRDGEHETDGYVAFSWIHTFSPNLLLTVSPFYHYSKASYDASPNDLPVITNVRQTSNYVGAQSNLAWTVWKNEIQIGVYGFVQNQNNYFHNVTVAKCVASSCDPSSGNITGGLIDAYFNDRFKVTSWLTLIAGFRQSHFYSPSFTSGDTTQREIVENASDPRAGVAIKIPHLNWVFRGFYGYYYQAPPLLTATGTLAGIAAGQGFAFAPLHGERDIEYQFGVTAPFHGWALDIDSFETHAENWLDHNNIGESNLFWPITWSSALIQGWELTLRSPRLWHRGQFHLAYSNQIAQATSPITGGLTCPVAMPLCPQYPPPGYAPVDHDQRNTLNLGFNAALPWQSYASTNVYYGSGFTNGLFGSPLSQYPGPNLPSHTTFDLSAGKSFRERFTVSVTALNVANRRVQLDNSLTFGGFHYNDPRQIYAEFRYRFHY